MLIVRYLGNKDLKRNEINVPMNSLNENIKEDVNLLTEKARSMTKQQFVDWYVNHYGDKSINNQLKDRGSITQQDDGQVNEKVDEQLSTEGPQPLTEPGVSNLPVGQIGPNSPQSDISRDWQGGSSWFGGSISNPQGTQTWPVGRSSWPGMSSQHSWQGISGNQFNQQVVNAPEWQVNHQGILPINLANRNWPAGNSKGTRIANYEPKLVRDKNGKITVVNVFIKNGSGGNGVLQSKPVQPSIDSWGPDDSDIGTNTNWQQVPDVMNIKGLPNVPGMN